MKKITILVSIALALGACDATVEQAGSSSADAQPPAAATAAPAARARPSFANRGFRASRPAWKNAHFETPDQQYGNFTYFTFSRLALVASAQCNVPLDAVYFESAQAIGRRAVFQNKAAREARAKAEVEKFDQAYGPFDPDDPSKLCQAVERNKADQTLFGALFF